MPRALFTKPSSPTCAAILIAAALLIGAVQSGSCQPTTIDRGRIGIVFDTDMGNDIDDALAVVVMAEAGQRKLIQPLAVLSSNSSPWAVPGTQALLAHYGLSTLQVGASAATVGMAMDEFTRQVAESAGKTPGEVVNSVKILRTMLLTRPPKSVRIVATGFSTNLAALLESGPNFEGDRLPVSGKSLVEQKVEFLSIMAGNFSDPNHAEFNVAQNVPAFKKVVEEWPGPIYLSGYEIGEKVFSRSEFLEKNLLPTNPVWQGYAAYFKNDESKKPWDRPSWDQTAMLVAIDPATHPFALSEPVRINVSPEGKTTFEPDDPATKNPRRFLKFTDENPPKKVEQILESWYKEAAAPKAK